MTLKDPYPRFQDDAILWRSISQNIDIGLISMEYFFSCACHEPLWNAKGLFTLALLNSVISSDFEWLSKIFNDTKRCMISATAELLVNPKAFTVYHLVIPN